MSEAIGGPDPWADRADDFVDKHYGSVRGQVRLRLARRQLETFVPGGALSIVDVGGGAGTNSIPWARDGHSLTILDSSPAMLDRARAALSREDPATAARVAVVEGSAEAADGRLDGETFDIVMCHGVIMYVEDPDPLLDALAGLCRRGGLVSMIAKNQAALATMPVLEGRWGAALQAFDATHEVNRLGMRTRGDTVEDLSARLKRRGMEILGWYGVRLFSDGWLDDALAADDFEQLLEVEFEAARRDPYRGMSRLFHLIGRKRATKSN